MRLFHADQLKKLEAEKKKPEPVSVLNYCNIGLQNMSKQDKGFFRAIFLDLFLRIFVRAFLNIDFILFCYLPKNLINDFQLRISSTYQYIAKFRSKCA